MDNTLHQRLGEALEADMRYKKRILPRTWDRRRTRHTMTIPLQHAIAAFVHLPGGTRTIHLAVDRGHKTLVEIKGPA